MAIAWNQAGYVPADGTDITGAVAANDFAVASNRIVKKLTVFLSDSTANDNGLFDSFSGTIGWAIYSNNGGKPGTLLFSGTDSAPSLTDTGSQSGAGGDIFKVDLALGEIGLGTGTYWIAIHEGGWGAGDDGTPVEWMWNPAGTGWGLVQGAPVTSPSLWATDLHDSAFSIDGVAAWDQSNPTTAGGIDISQARGAGASFSLSAKTFMGGATAYLTDGVINNNGQLDSFSGNLYWAIYSSVGGKPGTGTWAASKATSIVMTDTGLQSASGADIIRVDFAFDRLTSLPAGDYFLVLHEGNDATAPFDGSSVYWSFNASGTGPDTMTSSVVGGVVQWTASGSDTSFQLWDSVFYTFNESIGNVYEDSTTEIDVLANDWWSTTDFTLSISRSPDSGGTAVVDDNGTPNDATDDFIRYTPGLNKTGNDAFEYMISNGTASKTGTVYMTVTPVNDAPTITNFDGDSALWIPVVSHTLLDTGTLSRTLDIDLIPVAQGNFGGGTLTITVTGGAPGEDEITFATTNLAELRGNNLYVQGEFIGTMVRSGESLTVTFNDRAQVGLVSQAIQALAYTNVGANPTGGTRTVTYSLTDGDGTANGGNDTLNWSSTVNVVALDTTGIANADTRDLYEGQKVNIAVLANDSNANGPLAVASINNIAISSGGSVTLPSGAVVTLLANGKLQYDPNGAFDHLVSAATGAARGAISSAVDKFVYTLPDGSTALVSVTVNGVDSPEGRFAGSAGNDVMTGTAGSDTFLLGAGGNDNASGGDGDDIFYFGGTLTAGDVINGGAGNDSLVLQGNYGHGFTGESVIVGAGMLNGIELLVFAAGTNTSFGPSTGDHYYSLELADGALAAGKMLTVQGSKLGAMEGFHFDGSEADGVLRIMGGAGYDTLIGGAANDQLWGGGSINWLTGGGGADTFFFRNDVGIRDYIEDLQAIDRIDLSAMDANLNVAGDQAFVNIGSAAFSGVAGQLRIYMEDNPLWYFFEDRRFIIQMDRDGDGVADYEISAASPTIAKISDISIVL